MIWEPRGDSPSPAAQLMPIVRRCSARTCHGSVFPRGAGRGLASLIREAPSPRRSGGQRATAFPQRPPGLIRRRGCQHLVVVPCVAAFLGRLHLTKEGRADDASVGPDRRHAEGVIVDRMRFHPVHGSKARFLIKRDALPQLPGS